jgi:probable rRNA maturation factor
MNQHTAMLTADAATTDEPDDPGPCTDSEGDEPARPGPCAQVGSPTDEEPAIAVECAAGLAEGLDLRWLGDTLRAAAARVARPIRRITARVVDDAEMTALHERHLGLRTTTDVLTFAMSAEGEAIDADVAVCVDEARRRAAALEHAAERELLLYALHGVLHCAGFDDIDEASSAAMHAEEDRILGAIGVGATFARGPSGHDDARDASGDVTEARGG